MSALGNGGAAPKDMQVKVVEKRTFAEFGYDVGPPVPGANGVPTRELLFVTPGGILFAFPLDVMGLAGLKAKLSSIVPDTERG